MKNQNGFGSIVCLDKTGKKRRKPYAVRITTGWNGGKQSRKYIGYYETQADALIALAEYHKNGVDVDLTKLTLNEVYDKWIERIEKKDLSASVVNMHRMARSRFGKLGETQLNKIKTAHLQDWLDNIDLKPSSKTKLKSTLIQLFKYAVANDIVAKNYAEPLEINEKIEQVGKLFTKDEIDRLWKLRDRKEARQLLILLYTGMRIGEMLLINKKDINFDEGYIIGGLKTEAGRNRVIPLHKAILPLVKEQLGDNNWLMQSNRGLAMSYRNASNHLNNLFKELGMDHHIHDTRKTCVSWLHTEGIPMETIRIIVGHSGKGVTEKVYLYKEPKELVDIVNSIEIPY
jgi:integrase